MSNYTFKEEQMISKDIFPRCPSYQSPSIDLITNLEHHYCQYCLNSLKPFTKIIAQSIIDPPYKENSTYRIFCVSCFVGWSTRQIGNRQFRPACEKYYILKPTDCQERSLNDWSVNQLYSLTECIKQIQANQIGSQVLNNFNQMVLSNRSLIQLKDKYAQMTQQIQEHHLLFFEVDPNQQNEQIMLHSNTLDVRDILKSWEFDTYQAQKKAQQLLQQLHYGCQVDHVRLYPDNHSNFVSRIIASNQDLFKIRPQQKKIEQSIQYEGLMCLFQEQLQKKYRQEKEINNFLAFFIYKHSINHRRENVVYNEAQKIPKKYRSVEEKLPQQNIYERPTLNELEKEISDICDKSHRILKADKQRQRLNTDKHLRSNISIFKNSKNEQANHKKLLTLHPSKVRQQ